MFSTMTSDSATSSSTLVKFQMAWTPWLHELVRGLVGHELRDGKDGHIYLVVVKMWGSSEISCMRMPDISVPMSSGLTS